MTEQTAATIHRRGELCGKPFVLHRLGPRLEVLLTFPVGGLPRAQNGLHVLARLPLAQRGEVRKQTRRGVFCQMLSGQLSQADELPLSLQEPHRYEQSEHHIDGARLQTERAANGFIVRRFVLQAREEVQVHERGAKKVHGEDAVTVAVERGWITLRCQRQIKRAHAEVTYQATRRDERLNWKTEP